MQIINTSNWPNLETATNARLTVFRNASAAINNLATTAEGAPNNITGEIQNRILGSGAFFDMTQQRIFLGAENIVQNPIRNYGIANATSAANLPALAISECAEAVVYELLNWRAQQDYMAYDKQMKAGTLKPWARGLAYAEREAQVTYDHAAWMQTLINGGQALSAFSTRNIAATAAYLNDIQGYKTFIANGPHAAPPGGLVTETEHLPSRQMYYFEAFGTFGSPHLLGSQLKGLLQLAKAPHLQESAEKAGLAKVDNWLMDSRFSVDLSKNAYPHFFAVMVSVAKRIADLKPQWFKLQSPHAEFSADMLRLAKNNGEVPKLRLDKIQAELKVLTSALNIGAITITEDGAK